MLCAAMLGTAQAEEGGSGHYLPGAMASFVDAVPLEQAFIIRGNLIHYKGSIGKAQLLPIAGLTTAGAQAQTTGLGLTAFWLAAVPALATSRPRRRALVRWLRSSPKSTAATSLPSSSGCMRPARPTGCRVTSCG